MCDDIQLFVAMMTSFPPSEYYPPLAVMLYADRENFTDSVSAILRPPESHYITILLKLLPTSELSQVEEKLRDTVPHPVALLQLTAGSLL